MSMRVSVVGRIMRVAIGIWAGAGAAGAQSGLDRSGVVWETLEWSVANPTYSGNPFDLAASVVFSREGGGEQISTGLFYDGNNQWKFRFTGTRTGVWTFTTSSSDPDLDGLGGAVTVTPNPDGEKEGFLGHQGNKYAVQYGNNGDTKGYLFNVYMTEGNFRSNLDVFGSDLGQASARAQAYLDEAKQDGFEIIHILVYHNWFEFGARTYNDHGSSNPDPLSFEVLEEIIATVYASGGRVHLWAWGDDDRTPGGLSGGINGTADRRVQRYIAARLGPLPGWTMGYGFDLFEWASGSQVNSWASYLHERMGWQHLLAARGEILSGGHNMNSYDGFGRNVPLRTTSGGPQDYGEVLEDMNGDLARPHFYEERHTYLRSGFNLDMDGTRRLLWWEAMAGGMGGFFGFFSSSPQPYPNPEQLRTHYTFWHENDRFLLSMAPQNGLITGGYCLKSSDAQRYVFYREGADSMTIDLSGMNGSQPAVGVNLKNVYQEIPLGGLAPGPHTLNFPESSDWAVAVGVFNAPADETPPSAPAGLDAAAASESQVDLTWEASSDAESGISGYKVYRDGVDIGDALQTSFSDTGLADATQYVYEVSAVNGADLESVKSNQASATTPVDTTRPTVVSVRTAGETSVEVEYGEPVGPASAADTGNYAINNGIAISNAVLGGDGKTVTLTTSAHAEEVSYRITVNNVKDRAQTPNTIAADSRVDYVFVRPIEITNLWVATGKAYETEILHNGEPSFIDRTMVIEGVGRYDDLLYIKTANNDKTSTSDPFLSFSVNQDVRVYVAHDDRIAAKPAWLAGYSDSGDDVFIGDVRHSLWIKNFSEGPVVLGGNGGVTFSSMYVVVLEREGLRPGPASGVDAEPLLTPPEVEP